MCVCVCECVCVCQETHLRQLMQKNLAKNLWISRAELIQQRPSYSVVLMSKSRTTLTQSTDACLQPHRKTTCHEYLTDKFQLLKLTRNDFEVRIRMTPLYSIVITRDSNASGATSLHLKETTNNNTRVGHVYKYVHTVHGQPLYCLQPPSLAHWTQLLVTTYRCSGSWVYLARLAPSISAPHWAHLLITLSPSVSTEMEMLSGQASKIVTFDSTAGTLSLHTAGGSC